MVGVYAIGSAIFFGLYAWGMMTYGTETVRSIILVSLFVGAISQFLAQDGRPSVTRVALGCSYLGMFLAAVALVLHLLGH